MTRARAAVLLLCAGWRVLRDIPRERVWQAFQRAVEAEWGSMPPFDDEAYAAIEATIYAMVA